MSQKDARRDTAIRKTVKKRNKRRKRKLALFFTAFMIIALAVVFVLSATVLFPIKNVIVEGRCEYTDEDIIAAAGIDGDNIIMMSGDKVKGRIAKNLPHCGKISIKKKFPDTVMITVKAAVPTYYFVDDGTYYITDDEYKVIEKNVSAPEDCIYLKIKGFKSTAPGNKVKFSEGDLQQIEDILKQCKDRTLDVTAVDVSNDLDLKIIVRNRLLVRFGGDIDFDRKLLHLYTILPRLSEDAQGTIDLRNWTSTDAESIFRDEKIDILGFVSQKHKK